MKDTYSKQNPKTTIEKVVDLFDSGKVLCLVALKVTVSCLAYFGNNRVERELGNYIQALTAI